MLSRISLLHLPLLLNLFLPVLCRNSRRPAKPPLSFSDASLKNVSAHLFSTLCFDNCDFKLCNDATNIMFGFPMVATANTICRKDSEKIRFMTKTKEALVYRDERMIPISRFKPFTLSNDFQKDFFLMEHQLNHGGSGISMDMTVGNQHRIIDGECIVMPITEYEGKRGSSFRKITSNKASSCVAIRALVADIAFELYWDDGHRDFDIALEEPNGKVVTFNNKRSKCATHMGNNRGRPCRSPGGVGHEQIIMDSKCGNLLKGKYKILLNSDERCPKPAKWGLRVACGGKQKVIASGTAKDKDIEQVINFRYPEGCQ